MDPGPLAGTYNSALSSMVKMKRADVNSKNPPPFWKGEKGSPSPCLGALLDPSCQETIPSACSDKLIPENVFFPSSFPPPPLSCYNVFSIFNPWPSKLPSSLQTPGVMNEVLKIQNLNAALLAFSCLLSLILCQLWRGGQSSAYALSPVWSVLFFFFFLSLKWQIVFLVLNATRCFL